MEAQQALQLLDQVIHHQQLRFLCINEATAVEQAFQVVTKIVLNSLQKTEEN